MLFQLPSNNGTQYVSCDPPNIHLFSYAGTKHDEVCQVPRCAVPETLTVCRHTSSRHPVRPRPAGLSVVEAEEPRLGCGGRGGGSGPSPCSSTRAPTPPHWQSSVLVRSGAYSLPGPLRRSSAYVSAVSGAVAASVAVQLLNRAARLPSTQKGHHKEMGLGQTA